MAQQWHFLPIAMGWLCWFDLLEKRRGATSSNSNGRPNCHLWLLKNFHRPQNNQPASTFDHKQATYTKIEDMRWFITKSYNKKLSFLLVNMVDSHFSGVTHVAFKLFGRQEKFCFQCAWRNTSSLIHQNSTMPSAFCKMAYIRHNSVECLSHKSCTYALCRKGRPFVYFLK
jgi:hypothetical protein